MLNIDEHLSKISSTSWYQNWQQNKYADALHWSILALFIITIGTFQVTQIYIASLIEQDDAVAVVSKAKKADTLEPTLTGDEKKRSEDQILVKFKDTASKGKRDGVLQKHGLTETSEIAGIGVKIIKIKKDDETPEEVIDRLLAQHKDDIEFAEVDALLPPTLTPNDPSLPSQWEKTKTNSLQAWDIVTGDPNMIIGIADTGINCGHADLSCVPGWNVVSNDATTADYRGHGTAVAGTAAAKTNNGLGVAGQVWNSKVMPVRITNASDGWATCSAIAAGVTWAADHGAKVVNNSYDSATCSTITTAGKYLRSKGGLLVIGAGNTGTDRGIIANPDVIAVSGIQSNDALYSWSSFGNHIDVAAPGCVTSTNYSGGYSGACGTSFAAPMTAGTLALIFAANPALTPAQAENILYSTARDLGTAGWDTRYGWGAIDAFAAVTQAKNTSGTADLLPPSTPTNLTTSAPLFNQVNLSWSGSVDNVAVTGYKVFRDGTLLGIASRNSYQDTTTKENTKYTYYVSAIDGNNNESGKSASSSVTTPNISLVITSQQIMSKTSSSATIQASTNLPALVTVKYGTAATNLAQTIEGPATLATTQSITLNNLAPRTTYYYQVLVRDVSGALTATSPVSSFKTGGGKR